MGLFSFIKNLGRKAPAVAPPADVPAPAPTAKVPAVNPWQLKYILSELDLEVENLDLKVDDDTVIVTGHCASQEIREKVVLALGNVDGICCVDDQMTVATEEDQSEFYEVQKGDTLSKISKQFYGTANKYNTIFEANKPMLKSADLIYPGQVLRIPKLQS